MSTRLSQKATAAAVRYITRNADGPGTFAGIVTGTAVIMLSIASAFSDMLVSREVRLHA